MRSKIVYALVGLGVLMALVTLAMDKPNSETGEVLKRFTEAVGGEAAFQQRTLVGVYGFLEEDISWQEPSLRSHPFLALAWEDGSYQWLEDGRFYTSAGNAGEHEEPGLHPRLRWLIHPRFPLVVEEYFPGLEGDGRQEINGRWTRVLVPAGMDPDYHALHFDEETGLLVQIGNYVTIEGWREVDGVLFPETLKCSRKGGHTSYHFTEIMEAAEAAPE
jgi:hypothetical protein